MAKTSLNKTPIIVAVIAGVFLLLAIMLHQSLQENYENKKREAAAVSYCRSFAKIGAQMVDEETGFKGCMREKGWNY